MKHLILVVIITTLSIAAQAAQPLVGYVVMANNDTVKCKIKSGRFLSNPFNGIIMINEHGEEQAISAKDKKIIAFGFVERFRRYDYLFVDVGDRLENGFYQRIVDGPRYKLYSRPTEVYGGNPTYILFNQSREFVKFEPCVLCPWKKQLREFLKNDPKALEEVENAPRVNIPVFVKTINKK